MRLQGFGTVIEERGTHHSDRDSEAHRGATIRRVGLEVEGPLVLEREPGSAVLGGVRDPGEAGLEEHALKRCVFEISRVVVRRQVLHDPAPGPSAEGFDILDIGGGHGQLFTFRSAPIRVLCCSGVPNSARLTAMRRE